MPDDDAPTLAVLAVYLASGQSAARQKALSLGLSWRDAVFAWRTLALTGSVWQRQDASLALSRLQQETDG